MLENIDAPLVAAFLDDLEAKRRITARTRNLRLTAIHSFFRYVAFEAPANAAQTQRVLAIPAKRFTRTLVPFLSRPEVDALLAAPDQQSWSGRRDHAQILLAVQTGLRLSELINLVPADLQLGAGAHVHVIGKGRKERCTPLSKSTRAVLTAWIREPPKVVGQPVFPNAQGGRLSAHGVHYLLAKHVATASAPLSTQPDYLSNVADTLAVRASLRNSPDIVLDPLRPPPCWRRGQHGYRHQQAGCTVPSAGRADCAASWQVRGLIECDGIHCSPTGSYTGSARGGQPNMSCKEHGKGASCIVIHGSPPGATRDSPIG
jgi:integrase